MARFADTMPGHFRTAEGREMLERYADMDRAALCGGHLTDTEVAFQIAMVGRNDLDHEAKLLMAKDRIRWLSAQVAILQQKVDARG